MRKRPLSTLETSQRAPADTWLDLEQVASIELSSEDPAHPFEAALGGGDGQGWRAAVPGPQVLRLTFDQPTTIRRIRLEFREAGGERSQEFCLSTTSATGETREIARQQWNFSPAGSTVEVEEYAVDRADVVAFTLEIDPGRHDRDAFATLQSLRLA